MPTITNSIKCGGKTCILTAPDGTAAVGKATSITCSIGPGPTRAWVLLQRADLEYIRTLPSVCIEWRQTTGTTGSTSSFALAFPRLHIINAERVGFGGVGDANAIFLVELCDVRYRAARLIDNGEIDIAYATSSSWSTLVEKLWDAVGLLGTFPGIAGGLSSRPFNGERFVGARNAYLALCFVLDFLDCALCHNPFTGLFRIVALGDSQAIATHATELTWAGEAITSPVVSSLSTRMSVEKKHGVLYGLINDILPGEQVREVQWRNLEGGTSTEILAAPLDRTWELDGVFYGESSETTTTNTTPEPCSGRCKYTWTGTGWDVTTNGCGEPDEETTTTSSTTSTTTCAPSDVCCLAMNAATSTTTTTTPDPTRCQCQPPDFCLAPEDAGKCVYTDCAQGVVERPLPCSTSTTTTLDCTGCELVCRDGYYVLEGTCGGNPCDEGCEPFCVMVGEPCVSGFRCDDCTPTTTTPDCPETSTTTTTTVECGGPCHFISYPLFGGGFAWEQTAGCTPGSGCACAVPPGPTAACLEEDTPCTSTTTTTQDYPSCGGDCGWFWVPQLSRWFQTWDHCTDGLPYPCYCMPPSIDGDGCGPAVTACRRPDPGPPNPCLPTTTSTTSTTTADACGGTCLFDVDGGAWSIYHDPCSPECECAPPAIAPIDSCEVGRSRCVPTTSTTTSTTAPPTTTTTTTTAAPTTTTTSTTTTTTAAPCMGNCQFVYNVVDGGIVIEGVGYPLYSWGHLDAPCAVGCACRDPQYQGSTTGSTTTDPCRAKPCGHCDWTYRHTGPSIGWTLDSNNCVGGCNCVAPAFTPSVSFYSRTFCS